MGSALDVLVEDVICSAGAVPHVAADVDDAVICARVVDAVCFRILRVLSRTDVGDSAEVAIRDDVSIDGRGRREVCIDRRIAAEL